MDITEELNGQQYLLLASIAETGQGALRLVAQAAAESAATRDIQIGGTTLRGLRQVFADQNAPTYEIRFSSYIAYAVRNESYSSQAKGDTWLGKTFRVYSRSKFLDFVQEATFATPQYPGPFKHYCLVCQDHIVDVVSTVSPQVSRLS